MIRVELLLSEDDFEELMELRSMVTAGAHPALDRLLEQIHFWKDEEE